MGTNTETNGTATTTETPTPQPTNIPFSRVEVVEGFEENLARWRALSGKVTIDRKNPYQGNRSLVLLGENNGKTTTTTPTQTTNTTNATNSSNTTNTASTSKTTNTAGIARSYSMENKSNGGIDLRNHDLTMAVRFEKPVHGRVGIELVVPTKTMSLTSQHFIPKELNGWIRIDLGYTGKEGETEAEKRSGAAYYREHSR